MAPGGFSLLWFHFFSPTTPDATALTCRHPVNQQGLPLTLPVLRPGFLVILRAGMGSLSLAGWGGWGVGAHEWRWGGTHRSVSRGPAACPPRVFRRPLSGVFAPSASGLQGWPPTSQCPCLKGTRTPLIRGRWGALWPEPWPLLVLTGLPGSEGLRMSLGCCWVLRNLRLSLLRFSRPQSVCPSASRPPLSPLCLPGFQRGSSEEL